MTAKSEWGDRAIALERDEFARRYSHPFLFAQRAPLKPVRPQKTERLEIGGLIPLLSGEESSDGDLVVLPVAKVQEAFPSMVTVGRTQNNDVVIADPSVSKFHAFFRFVSGHIELCDAGSRNGTWVRDQKLEAKGRALEPAFGDALKFGACEFQLLDATELWTRLVKALDQWG